MVADVSGRQATRCMRTCTYTKTQRKLNKGIHPDHSQIKLRPGIYLYVVSGSVSACELTDFSITTM